MPRIELGKVVKIGPGHYRIVWPAKRGPKAKSGPQGGRPKCKRVPKSRQLPGMSYCADCNRELNANNTSGLCRECAPHDQKRTPDGA